jgi:hypothetical protein
MNRYEFSQVFIGECDNKVSTVTHSFDEDYLDEVVVRFEEFLRGCGYIFSGSLQIVDEEDAYTGHQDRNYHDSFSVQEQDQEPTDKKCCGNVCESKFCNGRY